MREVGSFEAKTHLASLLDAANAGETIIITKHGKPVAHLCPPNIASRTLAKNAAQRLRDLRKRAGNLSSADMIDMRDSGRR